MFAIEKLKDLRVERGLTQRQLADLSGVSSGNLAQYETGRTHPKFDALVKLAQALNVPIETFFEKDLRDSLSKTIRVDLKEDQLPLIVLKKDTTKLKFSSAGKPKGKVLVHISRPAYITDPNAYVVRIGDDTMSPGIEDSWMALVSPEAQVKENDYVVARLPSSEVVLRRFNLQDETQAILQPLNNSYRAISVAMEKLLFMHKVVTIMPD